MTKSAPKKTKSPPGVERGMLAVLHSVGQWLDRMGQPDSWYMRAMIASVPPEQHAEMTAKLQSALPDVRAMGAQLQRMKSVPQTAPEEVRAMLRDVVERVLRADRSAPKRRCASKTARSRARGVRATK